MIWIGVLGRSGLEHPATAVLPADFAEGARQLVDAGEEEEAARRNLAAGKVGRTVSKMDRFNGRGRAPPLPPLNMSAYHIGGAALKGVDAADERVCTFASLAKERRIGPYLPRNEIEANKQIRLLSVQKSMTKAHEPRTSLRRLASSK
jgi:hypothetical protein